MGDRICPVLTRTDRKESLLKGSGERERERERERESVSWFCSASSVELLSGESQSSRVESITV